MERGDAEVAARLAGLTGSAVPIPDFQSLMLPLLCVAGDGKERSIAEAREVLAKEFKLSEADRAQLLPSGRAPLFANRLAWAKFYLCQAGLLIATRRGYLKISPTGKSVLKKPPARIDIKFLERFPGFEQFRSAQKKEAAHRSPDVASTGDGETPEETLESAYLKLRAGLAAELLGRIKAASPKFFETLVVELLLKMGYGGSRREAAAAIGGTGDEGIDGIISEDRLGLDIVYLQAKRWDGTVGRPEIQKFVGALHGKRAKKGVFLTTGAFTADAREYVAHIDPKVVLIDGRQLAELLIDFEVGVTSVTNYPLKRIDSDYFAEE